MPGAGGLSRPLAVRAARVLSLALARSPVVSFVAVGAALGIQFAGGSAIVSGVLFASLVVHVRSMRWLCDRDGCFNERMRLRLGVYDHCFPGAIGLSDVDGAVELNGYFLLLEWKASAAPVPTGQRIMFERLTAPDERRGRGERRGAGGNAPHGGEPVAVPA